MRHERARQTIDWMETHLGVERLPIPPRIESIKPTPSPANLPSPVAAEEECLAEGD
ncbi:MAG TPA: hypothetical protein VN231_01870 [Allosphingosinicella sp.]|nr:hypothetical protein [Allosphingosinicella sp.]